MKKNVASQVIGSAMVSATDGSAFTGSVTVYVTGNGGAQAVGSVGSGACTHEGNGFHTYAPAQAETNYDHIGFTFIGTGAVPSTVQVFPTFPQTGDSFARIGAPTGASISADLVTIDAVVDSILVDTAEIGAAGAGLTNIGTIATVTNLTNMPTIPANWITAAGIAADAIGSSELATTAVDEIVAAVWAAAARTLTAATNFNNLSSTDVATAVWNAATATYGSAGSYGLLVETNLDAAVSGATAPSAATVADAVWDEAISGHLTAGTTGAALNAAGSAGDPWTTTLPGAYTGSQAGKMLSDIITDTAEIGAAGAGLTAVISSVPTATQNADALLNRDMSAVSDTNARSPLNALRLLRNKWTSSAGTLTVYKENDSTSAWTGTLTGDAAADPVVGSDPA